MPAEILSWGGGLQSTCLLAMSAVGDLPKIDLAIFSDTGWERDHTYQAVNFYKDFAEERGIPISIVSAGNIREDSLRAGGEWAATMPYFTGPGKGQLTRQCTKYYKIYAIRSEVRRFLGVNKRGRLAPNLVNQWIGISTDEIERAKPSDVGFTNNMHPLLDKLMSRADCESWFLTNGLPVPGKSSCIGCPYHSDVEWLDIKRNPDEWYQAVDFDRAIRYSKTSRGCSSPLFLHWSGTPLDQVNLKNEYQLSLWQDECSGFCGV